MRRSSIVLLSVVALASACDRGGRSPEGDGDSDVDVDVDIDADSDSDADAVSGGGGDADAEADRDRPTAGLQIIRPLSARDGGIDPALLRVITNIDATGSPRRDGGVVFRREGTVSKVPRGEIPAARRGNEGAATTGAR